MRRELHGIGGQVEQGLAQPRGVAAQARRRTIGVDLDRELLGFGGRGDDRIHLFENRRQTEVGAFELHPVGLDLGQVEHVVEQGQQVLAGGVDLVEAGALLGLDGVAAQQVAQADDGVHRRANLVAHVGQESALGQVGGFGAFARRGQFGRARGD